MPKSQSQLIPMLRTASRRPPTSSIRSYSCRSTLSHPGHGRRVQNRVPHRPGVVPHRSLAQLLSDLPFERSFVPAASAVLISPTSPRCCNDQQSGRGDHKPPDERIVKLGKTLRILSSHLPTLLVDPLPQEILSPNISLHLFPSTHPHLPTVKGKVAYRAALWTAPVAWGSMPSLPIVGKVKLRILSERMVPAGTVAEFHHNDNGQSYGDEKLVVRWVTECGENRNNSAGDAGGKESSDSSSNSADSGSGRSSLSASSASNGTNKRLSTLLGGEAPIFKLGKGEQFSGLFIFSFDEEGRIGSHTIEHADENTSWDRTAKVVTLTDWLLGKAKWPAREPEPALASALQSSQTRLAFRRRMSGGGGYSPAR